VAKAAADAQSKVASNADTTIGAAGSSTSVSDIASDLTQKASLSCGTNKASLKIGDINVTGAPGTGDIIVDLEQIGDIKTQCTLNNLLDTAAKATAEASSTAQKTSKQGKKKNKAIVGGIIIGVIGIVVVGYMYFASKPDSAIAPDKLAKLAMV